MFMCKPDFNRLDDAEICRQFDIKDRIGKETSRLALASLFCLPLAFFSLLLVMLPGPIGGVGALGAGFYQKEADNHYLPWYILSLPHQVF